MPLLRHSLGGKCTIPKRYSITVFGLILPLLYLVHSIYIYTYVQQYMGNIEMPVESWSYFPHSNVHLTEYTYCTLQLQTNGVTCFYTQSEWYDSGHVTIRWCFKIFTLKPCYFTLFLFKYALFSLFMDAELLRILK